KMNLIRDISHSIKTPIALTEMALLVVKKSIEKNDQVNLLRAADIANKNIAKVRKDITSIVEAFTIGMRKKDMIKIKRSSLKMVLDDVVNLEEPAIRKKSLNIKTELDPAADKILMDKKDLTLVIGNIIDNAVKYTSLGGITIKSEIKKDFAAVTISDTGCGLTKEDKVHMFEKFWKHNIVSEGTGLGLYICKEIVSLYDGNINLSSAGEGKGTIVYLELPLAVKEKEL
ncbi:MAG: HAMP domain-containing histidine kinase, partial [Candidatus Omnitrophica bacterium]|nr:HAMP domain-containing histidine kinase [Candidatus Omnitrophota bacterium]